MVYQIDPPEEYKKREQFFNTAAGNTPDANSYFQKNKINFNEMKPDRKKFGTVKNSISSIIQPA